MSDRTSLQNSMMSEGYLQSLVPYLQDLKLNAKSNRQLVSVARIYIALYNLVTINAFDDEFGDSNIFLKKADALFDIFRKRSGKEHDFGLRCDMVHTMFVLTGETEIILDREKLQECYCAAGAAAEHYLHGEESGGIAQAVFCKCQSDFLYPASETDDAYFIQLGQYIAGWIAAINSDGMWDGVSDDVALERIQVMNMNSYMFLDQTNDEPLKRVFGHYQTRIRIPDGVADLDAGYLHTLGRLYDTVLQGNACDIDKGAAKRIAGLMYDYSRALPSRNDDWFYCTSYVVHWIAEEIHDRIQAEMMHRIA